MTRSYGLNEPQSLIFEDWPPTKIALYEAARDLFWEKGFVEASLQEIVDRAGLTKGAFYHYYNTKEDILRIMYGRSLLQLIPNIEKIKNDRLPADQSVENYIAQLVKVIVDYPIEVRMYWEQLRRINDEIFPYTQSMRAVSDVLVDLLKRGEAEGVFKPMRIHRVTAQAIIGMCVFSQYWYVAEGRITPKDLVDIYSATALDGLRV